MRYRSFAIANFKGIASAEIKLSDDNHQITTLIGLNESGKTSLLEAVYSFSPDFESKTLFQPDTLVPDANQRIPRNKYDNFNDSIRITAQLRISDEERSEIAEDIGKAIGGSFDLTGIPNILSITNAQKYVNSEYKSTSTTWTLNLRVKTGAQRKWREPNLEERKAIWPIFQRRIPRVAYFPTVLSHIPARIYLRGQEKNATNTFYRTIFQDILSQIGPTYSIEDQILERIDADSEDMTPSQIVSAFQASPRYGKVQQVIDRAGALLSQTITERWNAIFRTQLTNKEIVITLGFDPDDNLVKPYISFAIKDGVDRYNVAERSLGFRWFFCFLLFTQFRAKRQSASGTLFLFDEPASNLHAKAQEKLIETFAEIAGQPNSLIYSTHSPYMINPLWLDQAYIVESKGSAAEIDDISTMAVSKDITITATPYRDYVHQFPDRTSHFQPVLDRLEVKPSAMDLSENTLLVEGKGDFSVLSALTHKQNKGFRIVPCSGASTLGPLIALLRGWGWSFAVLLDSDRAGNDAYKQYKEEFGIGDRIVQWSDIDRRLREPENLLSTADIAKIKKDLGIQGKLNKKHIIRYFNDAAIRKMDLELEAMDSDALVSFVELVNLRMK